MGEGLLEALEKRGRQKIAFQQDGRVNELEKWNCQAAQSPGHESIVCDPEFQGRPVRRVVYYYPATVQV